MRRRTYLALALGGVMLVGALAYAGLRPSWDHGTSSTFVHWDGPGDGVAGIDTASVSLFELKTQPSTGVRLVVWSDLPNQTGRGGNTRRGAWFEWLHIASDGRRIVIGWAAADGRVGPVSIAGRRFDPAHGSLVLVSTARKPYRMKQVPFNLARLPFTPGKETTVERTREWAEALQDLARADPQIRGFFENQ